MRFCLPAASAATCWVWKVSRSRVAVCIEWYSILTLPVRTYFLITVGRALMVNCLQNGHSRSPKYCSVIGALGLPRVIVCWGMPCSSETTSVWAVLAAGLVGVGAAFLPLPVATRMIAMM